jgi:hypothetical protein
MFRADKRLLLELVDRSEYTQERTTLFLPPYCNCFASQLAFLDSHIHRWPQILWRIASHECNLTASLGFLDRLL